MRLAEILFQSLREPPADAASEAEALLVRAGFLRRTDGGRTWLPLGAMALRRLETRIEATLDALGAREVVLPLASAPGRACEDDALPDPAALSPVFASTVRSYRQLPAGFRSIGTTVRSAGREPLMATSERLTIDVGIACAAADERAHALERLEAGLAEALAPLGLGSLRVDWPFRAGTGRALALRHPAGDTELLACDACGYASGRDAVPIAAAAAAPRPAGGPEAVPAAPSGVAPPVAAAQLPIEPVETPGTSTIAALAAFLGVGPERCAKATFFEAADGRLVTAIVRGDREVSEAKLAASVDARCLRPADPGRIRGAGMEPGYGSPVGAHGTTIVVDPACAAAPNLVAGANRPGWHLRNVNFGRDYAADRVADIARAGSGDACPRCGGPLIPDRALALAVLASLPERGAPAYLASNGVSRPLALAAARIELERVLVAVVQTHRDERGIAWPPELAPLTVHLVTLGANRDPAVLDHAASLERAARDAGTDLLWDDRDESPGVKLADADLVGLPVRLTVSPRSLAAGGVELVPRSGGERWVVPFDEALRIARGEAPAC